MTILGSDSRIAIFSVNHIQSAPTIAQLKSIHKHYDDIIAKGIDEVYCISFCDFVMFDFLMPKFSNKVKFKQFSENELTQFQTLLNKRGHPKFLKDYWQFACVINHGQVEQYIEQPFTVKLSADTLADIYSGVTPVTLLTKI